MIKTIKNNFILFLVFFTLLFLILDSIFKFNIPCVFKFFTGFYCPGCGVTRMLKSLLVLDFYQAFRYNPLLFVFTPFIIVLLINYLYCFYKKKSSLYSKIPKNFWNVLLVLTIVYWIIRNIVPFLAPTVV